MGLDLAFGKNFNIIELANYKRTCSRTIIARKQILFLLCALFSILILGINYYALLLFILNLLILASFAASIIFKAALFYIGYKDSKHILLNNPQAIEDYPHYTIIAPMYKEEKVLEAFIVNISKIDYPKDKLQVLVVLEENDHKTINLYNNLHLPKYFECVIIPYFKPQTKAKALNYAMQYIKGEFITIYDAEDIPHPSQLHTAISHFRNCNNDVQCLQAKLTYYNRTENLLTNFFCIEYAILFDFINKGLTSSNMALPLGGSSCHFRTSFIKQINGWDMFNLTEDAELGMLISILGFKSNVIDSYTYEEAPLKISKWLKQRSRWIKGYLQTYLLYLRNCAVCSINESKSLPYFSWQNKLVLHLIIGLPSILFILTPIVLALNVFCTPLWKVPLLLPGAIICFASVIQQIIFAFLAYRHRKWSMNLNIVLTYPFYIMLNIIASIIAIFELFHKPYKWRKTEHGLSKMQPLDCIFKE